MFHMYVMKEKIAYVYNNLSFSYYHYLIMKMERLPFASAFTLLITEYSYLILHSAK